MASARARLGASLACALAATLLPAAVAASPASAAPVVVAAPVAAGTVAAGATVTTSDRAVPVSRSARVVLTRTALRNPVLRGRAVIAVAKRLKGIPYRAGGTSPSSGFDCSGFTRYVFSRLGIAIPRVSRDQHRWGIKLRRSQAVPGDLVFFHRGGRVYHAAIYAGGNKVWHSPYPGKRVMRERIWASSVYFARVRVH